MVWSMASSIPQPSSISPLRPAIDRTALKPSPAREPLWRQVLGECLRGLRQQRGEKLSETAGRAGVSPQYLSEMERGVKEPSSEMIAAVAGALDVTLVDLTLAVAESLRSAQPSGSRGAVCSAAYALAA
ncbi:helix-turn-helix domain-containing protein [Nonomuraea angiospora]|jgi:DNA-binding XRE family transcriptional regulator